MSEQYPLIFAANRDERHSRPSAAAHWWDDHPRILGGRDLLAGGSWLAVDRRGRLAAVTNLSEPAAESYPRSRGHLVRDFLTGTESTESFLAALNEQALYYGPFNLLLFDGGACHYASNRTSSTRLGPGIYALSNAPLGSPWPKVRRARDGISACLEESDPRQYLFELLADTDNQASSAQNGSQMPEHTSTLFIKGECYGTRSSTVVLLSRHGELVFAERRFDRGGECVGDSCDRFQLKSPEANARAASS